MLDIARGLACSNNPRIALRAGDVHISSPSPGCDVGIRFRDARRTIAVTVTLSHARVPMSHGRTRGDPPMLVPAQWQPLRRKLPILISTLLVAVVVIVSALAYRQVEETLITAARERVTNGSQRLADMFTRSAWGQRVRAQHLAADSAVVRFLATPTGRTRAAVRRTLDSERASDPRVEAVALWSRDRRRVLLMVGDTVFSRAAFPNADDVPHDSAAGG